MGFALKLFEFLLSLAVCIYFTDRGIEGINVASKYFLTIDISNNGPSNVRQSLKTIKKALCDPKQKNAKCFLYFKVVGEPKVLVVMNVQNSAELERRLSILSSRNSFKYESEPVVDYGRFAINILGVSNKTAVLDGNTLKQSPEVVYCQFNINFGDKTAAEGLEIWKSVATAVFYVRNSGNALEIFKTLGERTVHLMTEHSAKLLDEILFGVPFAQEIPNTLVTTCKVARKF